MDQLSQIAVDCYKQLKRQLFLLCEKKEGSRYFCESLFWA